MTGEMAIGAFGVSVLLSIILRLIYNTTELIGTRAKPWVAILIGVALGIVVMYYNLPKDACVTFKMTVDHVLGGFMTGSTATGMYELTKKAT